MEFGVNEGGRPAHILIPDARLHLAEALIAPGATGAADAVPQQDLRSAKELLSDAAKLASPNCYLAERVQSALAKIKTVESK
jgi:hypothetical protein